MQNATGHLTFNMPSNIARELIHTIHMVLVLHILIACTSDAIWQLAILNSWSYSNVGYQAARFLHGSAFILTCYHQEYIREGKHYNTLVIMHF